MAKKTTGPPVIALVSSAGGLEALTRVLSPLPADLPASIIALQHLDPDRPSVLDKLLARDTNLEVRRATNGAQLENGVVYVVPEHRHLLVTPHRSVVLIVSGAAPPNRPSADLLLTSLAVSLGPDAIAVVLSGGGHDGATGATAVHDLGGVVIAADEESSARYSMPQATIGREDAVDHVLHVDDIAAKLEELIYDTVP